MRTRFQRASLYSILICFGSVLILAMPFCASCERDLDRASFSKSQLKKRSDERKRCQECMQKDEQHGLLEATLRQLHSEGEVSEFLVDHERIQSFVQQMGESILSTFNAVQLASDYTAQFPALLENHPFLIDETTPSGHPATILRTATDCLSLSCCLLKRHDSDQLLLGLTSQWFVVVGERTENVLSLCLEFVEHYMFDAHRTTQYAAALSSVILANQPTAELRCFNETFPVLFVVSSITRKLSTMLGQMPCDKLYSHGTSSIINLLPVLFHLGSRRDVWEVALQLDDTLTEYGLIHGSIFRIIHHLKRYLDRPMLAEGKTVHHPSVHFVRHLLTRSERRPWRQEIMDSHPIAFTIVCLIEVLGWWFWNDLALHTRACKDMLDLATGQEFSQCYQLSSR
jgi:hypothetical protein